MWVDLISILSAKHYYYDEDEPVPHLCCCELKGKSSLETVVVEFVVAR